jgi:Family of unknown function (DUF6335)
MREQPNLVTGDDEMADADRAAVNGEEAVGGSASVPSQNDSELLATAAGIEIPDQTPLDLKAMMEDRDRDRWELDADSASDAADL